jgi:hypothetical protein
VLPEKRSPRSCEPLELTRRLPRLPGRQPLNTVQIVPHALGKSAEQDLIHLATLCLTDCRPTWLMSMRAAKHRGLTISEHTYETAGQDVVPKSEAG